MTSPDEICELRTSEGINRRIDAHYSPSDTRLVLPGGDHNYLGASLHGNLSQTSGKPGYIDLACGNKNVVETIRDSAHGDMEFFGSNDHGSVTLRTTDGAATLTKINAHTVKAALTTPAGKVNITLHDVDHVELAPVNGVGPKLKSIDSTKTPGI